MTARHCVGAPLKLAPLGYRKDELVRPDQIRVGLGSTTDIFSYKKVPQLETGVVYEVQEIRAAESHYPDLAVLVLRNAINPTLGNLRPAMIFMPNYTERMRQGETFTAIGWGRNDKTDPQKYREWPSLKNNNKLTFYFHVKPLNYIKRPKL